MNVSARLSDLALDFQHRSTSKQANQNNPLIACIRKNGTTYHIVYTRVGPSGVSEYQFGIIIGRNHYQATRFLIRHRRQWP